MYRITKKTTLTGLYKSKFISSRICSALLNKQIRNVADLMDFFKDANSKSFLDIKGIGLKNYKQAYYFYEIFKSNKRGVVSPYYYKKHLKELMQKDTETSTMALYNKNKKNNVYLYHTKEYTQEKIQVDASESKPLINKCNNHEYLLFLRLSDQDQEALKEAFEKTIVDDTDVMKYINSKYKNPWDLRFLLTDDYDKFIVADTKLSQKKFLVFYRYHINILSSFIKCRRANLEYSEYCIDLDILCQNRINLLKDISDII